MPRMIYRTTLSYFGGKDNRLARHSAVELCSLEQDLRRKPHWKTPYLVENILDKTLAKLSDLDFLMWTTTSRHDGTGATWYGMARKIDVDTVNWTKRMLFSPEVNESSPSTRKGVEQEALHSPTPCGDVRRMIPYAPPSSGGLSPLHS